LTPNGKGVLAINGNHTIMSAQLNVGVGLCHPEKIYLNNLCDDDDK